MKLLQGKLYCIPVFFLVAAIQASASSDSVLRIANLHEISLSEGEAQKIDKFARRFSPALRTMIVTKLLDIRLEKEQRVKVVYQLKSKFDEIVGTEEMDGVEYLEAISEYRQEINKGMSHLSSKAQTAIGELADQIALQASDQYFVSALKGSQSTKGAEDKFVEQGNSGNKVWKELLENKSNNDISDLVDQNFDTGSDPIFGGVGREVKFPAFPRRRLNRDITITGSETFSGEVKIAFLGSEVSGGPTLKFERRYAIKAQLIAHGSEPILVEHRGLQAGVLNHSEKRRIVFFCTAEAQSTHSLSGKATLKVFGTGSSIERGAWESLTVMQSSGLAYIPFHKSDGKRTTLKDIENFCVNKYYPKVKPSLKKEVALAVSELVYEHKQNECVFDRHCRHWHSRLLPGVVAWTVPRCKPTKINGEPVSICRLRGKKGNACSVRDKNGKLLTAGYFEYPCDKGLRCVVTRKGGWFTNWEIYSAWKAECR